MKHILLTCISFLAGLSVFGQTATRQIDIQEGHHFLNFPVARSNDLKKTRIIHNGKVLDEFTIELAGENPDFWTFFDVSPYQGETITIEIEDAEDAQKGLDQIFARAQFPGQDSLYQETLRPQVHFSSRRGWHNDPNGLIYYNGEYHLFYQHNPYGWNWGNMHWGHAVSKDLLRWQELPDALYTPNHEDMAFSGSAVVDTQNTSGFRKNGIDPLIAVYTSTGRGECLALSYDNGRTFEDYEGNPVVKHKGRDPKVFWYEPGGHWVMIVYDESQTKKMSLDQQAMIRQHAIYTSPDLKNWTYQSSVADFFECPELFEIKVEGEPDQTKWVMYGANGEYLIGDFDGKKFTTEQNFKTYDHGGAFYASQMYNNIPAQDGRHIQIGWGRGIDLEGMPFNQCMTFPTQLKLRKTFDGLRLCPKPIQEISSLYKKSHSFENELIKTDSNFTAPVQGDVLHIVAEFERGDATLFGMNINGYTLAYDNLFGEFINFPDEAERENFSESNKTNYVVPDNELLKMEVIVDKAILEVFVNDGELYYVVPLNSVGADKSLEIFAKGDAEHKTILKKLEVHELHSVWPEEL